MVTWTFDLLAFNVGMIAGFLLAGCVICFVIWKDGSWDRGFSEGWNAKHDYLKMKEREDEHGKNADGNTETSGR